MGLDLLAMVKVFIFYAPLAMNSGFFRLVKNSVIIKGTAFTLCKSSFHRCRHCCVISMPKMQTDRQMAF